MPIIMGGHILHVEEEAQHLASSVEMARLRMDRDKTLGLIGAECDRELYEADTATSQEMRERHLYAACALRMTWHKIMLREYTP